MHLGGSSSRSSCSLSSRYPTYLPSSQAGRPCPASVLATWRNPIDQSPPFAHRTRSIHIHPTACSPHITRPAVRAGVRPDGKGGATNLRRRPRGRGRRSARSRDRGLELLGRAARLARDDFHRQVGPVDLLRMSNPQDSADHLCQRTRPPVETPGPRIPRASGPTAHVASRSAVLGHLERLFRWKTAAWHAAWAARYRVKPAPFAALAMLALIASSGAILMAATGATLFLLFAVAVRRRPHIGGCHRSAAIGRLPSVGCHRLGAIGWVPSVGRLSVGFVRRVVPVGFVHRVDSSDGRIRLMLRLEGANRGQGCEEHTQ